MEFNETLQKQDLNILYQIGDFRDIQTDIRTYRQIQTDRQTWQTDIQKQHVTYIPVFGIIIISYLFISDIHHSKRSACFTFRSYVKP